MTLSAWIVRQCDATVEGSTIAAYVADVVSSRLRAELNLPPTPQGVSISDSAGGSPAQPDSVSENFSEKKLEKNPGGRRGEVGAGVGKRRSVAELRRAVHLTRSETVKLEAMAPLKNAAGRAGMVGTG